MFHESIRRALETGKGLDEAIEEAAAPMRETIRQFLTHRPFQPFRIYLTDRHVEEIRNPEPVVLGPTTLTLRRPHPQHPGKWQDRCILALIHVVSLEPLCADEPTIVAKRRSEKGTEK